MINLKNLITEGSKNVKILISKKGDVDQLVSFAVHASNDVFVFLPKKSTELDKLMDIEEDVINTTLIKYLEKNTGLKFEWDWSYNKNGAGYGFKIDLDSILKKLK